MEQNPGIIAIKQTSPSNNLFLHAGSNLGSSLTGIFSLSKDPKYVIMCEQKKEKRLDQTEKICNGRRKADPITSLLATVAASCFNRSHLLERLSSWPVK